jgi:hypothetical protein
VAAWISDGFYNFYLVKNPKIDHKSTNTVVRGEMRTDSEIIRISENC